MFRQRVGKPNQLPGQCIIHQQALWAKLLSSADDMQTVDDKVQTIHLLFEYTIFSSNCGAKNETGVNVMRILVWAGGATTKYKMRNEHVG